MRRFTMRSTAASIVLGLHIAFVSMCVLGETPAPLLEQGKPVEWWFVYKFNRTVPFNGCKAGSAPPACPFGGAVQRNQVGGQQWVYATKENASLQEGSGCAGQTTTDPVGATFGQVYDQSMFYVIWNDQFYGFPKVPACGKGCGHSKGMLAWDESGAGVVMQVSTPSWPGAGSKDHHRVGSGNTLGCIATPNNIQYAQHFFSLRLTSEDVVQVLKALQTASVSTDPDNPQLVSNGGPADIQALVRGLGIKSDDTTVFSAKLSSGVGLISKPAKLYVPPWQLVSSMLGGTSIRTATWWGQNPIIWTTTLGTKMGCWNAALGKPGRVEIVEKGEWGHEALTLKAGSSHAKMGVSISNGKDYSIFGDMNQQGSVSGNCESSQNGRGGLFFVVEDETLTTALTNLMDGDIAPTRAPKPK